ncbi:MAG: hypothetical protein MZV64_25980 [Ignavibacteriales bacterium]|nr:hypothetical protein [Ignavibacteriales bacterium]
MRGDGRGRAATSDAGRWGRPAWKDALRYHRGTWGSAEARVTLDEPAVGRLVGAYWRALDAVEELTAHVQRVKRGAALRPGAVHRRDPARAPRASTASPRPEAAVFLAAEIERRHLPVTHLAPNFGVEKGVDYRRPGGLGELEARVRTISRIAAECGLMLDCHSGDDLGRETRRVFGTGHRRAHQLQGVAPAPAAPRRDAVRHPAGPVRVLVERRVRDRERRVGAGSSVAVACPAELDRGPAPAAGHGTCSTPTHSPSVGRRDAAGRVREP